MDELQEQGTEIFSHHGVIFRNPNNRDDDSCLNGTLSIVQYSFGKCIEWKPTEVSEVLDCPEQDWSLVTTVGVGTRSRTLSSNSGQPGTSCISPTGHKVHRALPGLSVKVLNAPIVQSLPNCMMRRKKKRLLGMHHVRVPRNEGQQRAQPVRIELRDLKSYRVKKHGRYLTLMQRDGTSHNAFYFQYGSTDCFVNALRGILRTRRSQRDKNLFIVLEEHMESQSLNKSFAELNLFPENPTDVVWKFVSNLKHRPYETTMETFSKLTDALLYRVPDQRPVDEVADLLNRSLSRSLSVSDHDPLNVEEDYQMVPALPPRPEVKRGAPLTAVQWSAALDQEGRVVDAERVKQIIFRGGITPSLRHVVWKFLLGYYPWNSTLEERQELRKTKVDEYFRMKLQWRSMSHEQEERFADYRDRKSLIEKDVNRTDRTLPFFEGDNNANLALLQDILMTYVMYNFDLGYVQGMSDLLSPILILMSNEVDAFWCFVGLMERVCTNFDIDQAGMKKQLSQLHSLLSAAEPELALYLDQHDSSNMFFCFRWLLVLFKREFTHEDIMSLWEVIFTDIPCLNFHLVLCVAILDCEKNILIENRYGFTEILKHINDLSLKIDVDKILRRAESIYLQLQATPDLQINVKRIIGLAPPVSRDGSSDEDEDEEVSEHTDTECERVNFIKDTGEVAFEKSINLNYH